MTDDDKDNLEVGLVVSGIVVYALAYLWGAFWVWDFLPEPRKVWWGFPAFLTTVALFFLPIPMLLAYFRFFSTDAAPKDKQT